MKRTAIARKTPIARGTSQLERTGTLPRTSEKRRKHRASDEGKAGMDHMARVRALPCVICTEWGLPQITATEAHHIIHDRFASRKVPDTMTIPLCDGHHQGNFDTTKVAIHRGKETWATLYGPDHEWLSWVEQRLGLDQ